MSPKSKDTDKMCIPKGDACDYLALGLDAADFLETELAKLHEIGISTPDLDNRAKQMRRKLKAAEKKWDL